MGKMPLFALFKNTGNIFRKDEIGLEIAQIALPATLALAADPIASLVDTAFIGQIGPVELAAVGVSIAIFNQVSRITIFPLVSVTTSLVAEEDTIKRLTVEAHEEEKLEKGFATSEEMEELISEVECKTMTLNNISAKVEARHERKHIPSASSALVIGSVLGLIQTFFLIAYAKPILNYMGVNSDSPMIKPAQQYLTLRSIGAPAVLLSLALQGIFRGFKDTKTPFYATSKKEILSPVTFVVRLIKFLLVLGDLANVILDPIFIFLFNWGVSGAAIAHVISQYLISLILLWKLIEEVDLLPPSSKDLKFGQFLKNGFLLMVRVIAVTFCVTLAASLAARQGSTSMAAFQVCLQIWLATSLLADGLAVAAQTILASAFVKKDYDRATTIASRVLQFIAVTQPINALAFVFDGINFGASDFAYSAYSMVSVAVVSILCLFILSSSHGYVGIWVALSMYMSLRAIAGFLRIGSGSGPWSFLKA
ncbi:protein DETOXIFICATION 42 [Citrus sinensis]|uniref:Protein DETOXIFICATION 42 n=1 Tax=Citrus sinensis TaxID=2711 RepID=A0ACB8HX75_CITSI|nr:protein DETOXIFICATION 42 [Citrus sinensis]